MKSLHIRFRGKTASFRIPFAISGVQATSPVPTYSTLLGLISCCAGKNITPKETRIGFIFSYMEKALDLERIIRWDYNPDKPGKAKLNTKGPGIRKREYLINPILDLFITNLGLRPIFEFPKGIPTLGRSQDLAYIDIVEEIELNPVQEGKIGGTLIPLRISEKDPTPGLMFRTSEYFEFDPSNYLRKAKNNDVFIATNAIEGAHTPIKLDTGLYLSESYKNGEETIYLHEWLGDS